MTLADQGRLKVNRIPAQVDPEREKDPEYQAALQKAFGNDAFRANDFQGAIDYYTKSLSFRPNVNIVLANRSAAHLRLKQWKEAEADCTTSMALEPT